MTQVLANRVKESTTSSGTGALTLAGALTGFRSFSSKCVVGDTFRYGLHGVDSAGAPTGEWEVGIGTYSATNQITRVAIDSSNAGGLVNLSAGTKHVWIGADALMAGWSKEILTADRTYYVSTTGSDTKDGTTLANACRTVQKVIDFLARSIDLNGYVVVIQLSNGTYDEQVTCKTVAGTGIVYIRGDYLTPANVVFASTVGNTFAASGMGNNQYILQGMKLGSQGTCVSSTNYAKISLVNFIFGASLYYHMMASNYGEINPQGNYSVTAGTSYHIYCYLGGRVTANNATVTFVGTIAFTSCFIVLNHGAFAFVNGNTYTGTVTGKRHELTLLSMCFVNSASTTYFPGNAPGTISSGAQMA